MCSNGSDGGSCLQEQLAQQPADPPAMFCPSFHATSRAGVGGHVYEKGDVIWLVGMLRGGSVRMPPAIDARIQIATIEPLRSLRASFNRSSKRLPLEQLKADLRKRLLADLPTLQIALE